MMDAIFTTDDGRRKIFYAIGALVNEYDPRIDTTDIKSSDIARKADWVASAKLIGTGRCGGDKDEFFRLVREQLKTLLPPIKAQYDAKAEFANMCWHYQHGRTWNDQSYWFQSMPVPGSLAYRERMAAIAKVVESDAAATRIEVQAISVLQQLAILFQAVAHDLPPAPVKLRDLDMPF